MGVGVKQGIIKKRKWFMQLYVLRIVQIGLEHFQLQSVFFFYLCVILTEPNVTSVSAISVFSSNALKHLCIYFIDRILFVLYLFLHEILFLLYLYLDGILFVVISFLPWNNIIFISWTSWNIICCHIFSSFGIIFGFNSFTSMEYCMFSYLFQPLSACS